MNLEDIKVSLIAPVYNVDKYLSKCIDSVLEQTHKNLEIIFVNDGSTDNSAQILDEYAKKDVRIKVIHKENSRVSATRNVGIENATGDYICFADSDDYLMPDYVEYLLKLAVENDADISLTTDMYTNYYANQTADTSIRVCTPEQATIEILAYNIPIGVYCKMFKRDFINANKIRFIEDIYIGEGFNFNTYSFQRANKVIIGHRKVYYYRRNNPDSATTKFVPAKWVNGLAAIDRIQHDFIIHTKALDNALEYARWHTNGDVVNFILMSNSKKENLAMYKACRKIERKNGWYAFKVPVSMREKVRAIIMMFFPGLMPKLFVLRSKKHKVKFD